MTGLEKVTGKILAEAEAEARAIRDRAEAECAAIEARCEAEIEAERERLREQNDRACRALIIRTKSSAAMAKRNAVLEARAALLNEAYAAAEKQLKAMDKEAYLGLLVKMLRSALLHQLEGEAESLRLYAEDIAPEVYEILLNSRDRAEYGERLSESFRAGLGAKFPAAALRKLRVASDTAEIDGGLLLRAGAVEINYSFEMLLAETRRETEAKVSRILFGETV